MAAAAASTNSAKAMAQDLAAWYLDQTDPMQAHAVNVETYLRGPVTALTVFILSSSSSSTSKASTSSPSISSSNNKNGDSTAPEDHPLNNNSSSGKKTISGDWQKFLSNESEQETQRERARLAPRAVARLDAFLEGVALAVPSVSRFPPALPEKSNKSFQRNSSTASTESYGLVEGIVGFSNLRPSPIPKQTSLTSIAGNKINRAPSILQAELVTRLELYFRSLHRVLAQHHHCVVALEPAKALRARTRSLVRAFVATVGTVQHVSPVLTRLLSQLTKELLAIGTLSENLVRVIRRIVSDYVHTTSFASLAFLSTPETAADQRLTPVILKYLLYLQKNWQHCEQECNVEQMLATALDSEMRHTFKTAEFESIGHLLEVCSSYRDELQNIQLASRTENNYYCCASGTAFGCGTSELYLAEKCIFPAS